MNRAQLPHTYKPPNEARLPPVYDCGIRNAGTAQPYQCTLARIDFHRKGDEAEQCSHGKQDDTCQQQLWKSVQHQDTAQQYPRHNVRSKRNHRHQLLRIVSGA